jgi:DNA-binding response OmpR family regulator
VARKEATTRHRILIVDDEESFRLLIATILSTDLKAEVQLAGTSVQALRFAESRAYDAIVLDLMMPGMNGFDLVERIRATASNATTPVVIVSAASDESTAQRAHSVGANAYHAKPVRRAELVATVKAQLAARAKPTPR